MPESENCLLLKYEDLILDVYNPQLDCCINKLQLNIFVHGAGEKIRTLVALPEDLGSIPDTQKTANSSPRLF
ncbi:hypothetical protein STEG23_024289 [Scotinomys teguina]